MENKVRIAVIDSGVNICHPYIKGYIAGGIGIQKGSDGSIYFSSNFKDENGHGTLCASVIVKECKDAEIFCIKILDDNRLTTVDIFEKSLLLACDLDIKIILLSLAIVEKCDISALRKLCCKLEADGKIVISSLANNAAKSNPAILPSVIGVQGFILESSQSYWFNKYKKIQVIMDSNSYLHADHQCGYRLFGKCNSYAAAKMCGVIAKYMSSEFDRG